MEIPSVWFWVTGIYAGLASVFMIVLVFATMVLLRLVMQLLEQVKDLTAKVDRITAKVETTTTTVQSAVTDMSVRVNGLVRYMDDSAQSAFGIIDRFAPFVLLLGLLMRLFRLGKRR